MREGNQRRTESQTMQSSLLRKRKETLKKPERPNSFFSSTSKVQRESRRCANLSEDKPLRAYANKGFKLCTRNVLGPLWRNKIRKTTGGKITGPHDAKKHKAGGSAQSNRID